jgi:hypothetical protein
VDEVETPRIFDHLDVATTNRIRSLNFPRFSGMSSCMGFGELGGSWTMVSLDGGDGD